MGDERAQHGGEQHAAEQAAVEVADDLLEHEGDGGDGGVEGGGEAGGGARGGGGAAEVFRRAEHAGEVGGEARGELHGRTFATEAGAAADGERAADELHPDDAPRDGAKVAPEGEFHLRDAAAGGVGTEAGEQPAGDARGDGDEQETADEETRERLVGEALDAVRVDRVDGEVKGHRDQTRAQAEDGGGGDGARLGREFLKGAGDQVGDHPRRVLRGGGSDKAEKAERLKS